MNEKQVNAETPTKQSWGDWYVEKRKSTKEKKDKFVDWFKNTFKRPISWVEYWFRLLIEILRRLLEPLIYPTFVIYFVTVIIAIGGLGVWVPYFSTSNPLDATTKLILAKSMATYFLAIVATAFADLSFTFFEKLKDFNKNENVGKKYPAILSLWSFSFMTTMIVITIGGISLIKETDIDFVFSLSCLGAGLSLFLWWLANYDNKKLKESNFEQDYDPKTALDANLVGKGVEDGTIKF